MGTYFLPLTIGGVPLTYCAVSAEASFSAKGEKVLSFMSKGGEM